MIIYKKATSIEELEQILELQQNNLPVNLSKKEKIEQGFVTVEHTVEILEKMNNTCSHTIAKYNDKVVGYALSMTKDFAKDIEVLQPMFIEISKSIVDENYLVMGQICIDKNFRKQGVFKGLYEFMRKEICSHKFNLIITEIALENERSLKRSCWF